MDMQTAVQARNILNQIEYLKDIYEKIKNSDSSFMHFTCSKPSSMLTIECKKGEKNGEYVRYVLDGIARNIQDLEEGLKDL